MSVVTSRRHFGNTKECLTHAPPLFSVKSSLFLFGSCWYPLDVHWFLVVVLYRRCYHRSVYVYQPIDSMHHEEVPRHHRLKPDDVFNVLFGLFLSWKIDALRLLIRSSEMVRTGHGTERTSMGICSDCCTHLDDDMSKTLPIYTNKCHRWIHA